MRNVETPRSSAFHVRLKLPGEFNRRSRQSSQRRFDGTVLSGDSHLSLLGNSKTSHGMCPNANCVSDWIFSEG